MGEVENASSRLGDWSPHNIDVGQFADEHMQEVVSITKLTPTKRLRAKTLLPVLLTELVSDKKSTSLKRSRD